MSKISNPKSTPEALSDKEMETYVKQVLVPIVDKFVANHKGKEFTATDIEGLYEDLNKSLSKNPKIMDKWGGELGSQYAIRKEMAVEMAADLNKKDNLSRTDKLIHGFGQFCKKIGLGAIGAACLKNTQKVNLSKSLDKITTSIASTKMSVTLTKSASQEAAKPIKQKESRAR
ncbi:MAG: hypothetical protein AB8B68_03380 [Rickettsiaceae bacterium]